MEKNSIIKPDFFIVGAPKCGTTAMDDYLKQHPEIFIPNVKEINFFGTDLYRIKPTLTEELYLSFFSSAAHMKRIGESTVWYLYSKRAAAAIREYSPSAQIIIMLRNPVDMIYSLHTQLVFNGDEDIEDFKSALDAENERKQGRRIPDGPYKPERFYYREIMKYSGQVKRYLDIFGPENVCIIIFDDFVKNVAGEYRRVLDFLKVREDFQPEFKVINPSKKVRSRIFRNFLRNPPDIALRLGRLLVPKSQRFNVHQKLVYMNARYEERPKLDPELRRQLQKELLPEVETLSALLGRDLTHWCRN